ncbi:MAG: hypothetical protein J6R05_03530, partial [Bacteroidaceae bacterium]|nr:hypothetical protein [Bacteroidaceae bacterium]
MPQAQTLVASHSYGWNNGKQAPHAVGLGYTSTQINFTKKLFEVKPVGKLETASWEKFISLLE